MIDIEKVQISGKKGKTVCYSINNLRIEGDLLLWDNWQFMTPLGSLELDGEKYFDVPATSFDISRDDTLDKEISIVVKSTSIDVLYTLEGEVRESVNLGLDGDIVVTGIIPSDITENIKLQYYEVKDAGQ